MVHTFTVFLDNASIIFFQLYRDTLDKNTQFLIHNFIWVMSIEGFFGIYLPLKHLILSRDSLPGLWLDYKAPQMTQFYTREPSISPRRYFENVTSTFVKSEIPEKIFTTDISKSNRKRNKFKGKMRNQLPPISE